MNGGAGRKCDYAGNLLAKRVLFEGQTVDVVEAKGYIDGEFNADKIVIKLPDGIVKDTTVDKILAPYNLK